MSVKKFTNKLEALYAKDLTATGKFELGNEQKEEIVVMLNELSFIDMLREDLPVSSVHAPGQGSITILKQPNGSLTDKTLFGGKVATATTTNEVTLSWGRPKEAKVGIMATDRDRGLGNALLSFLAKHAETGRHLRETEGLNGLIAESTGQAKVAANTLGATDVGVKLRDKILAEAAGLISKKIDAEGIDTIPMEKIIIFIDPVTAVTLETLVGDFTKETYLMGNLNTATFGGYKFVVNPFMNRATNAPKVIITTTFSYASFINIINAQIDRLPGSADQVANYEQAVAQGLIYDNVTKVFY